VLQIIAMLTIPRLFLYLHAGFLLIACSGKNDNAPDTKSENDSTTAITKADSLLDLNGELRSLALGFTEITSFPLVLDTAITNHFDDYDSLPGDDARMLFSKAPQHNLNETPAYLFDYFLKIDSLKRAGEYSAYVESLDIGMIKEARTKKLFRVRLHPETLLIVWGMDYHSYEACPWSRGSFVFVTIVHKGEPGETLCLSLNDAGGDPPVSGNTERQATIQEDGSISIHQKDISDEDMDEPEVSLKESSFEFMITKNVFRHVRSKEGKDVRVKREEVGY